jgi:hypothetical protein
MFVRQLVGDVALAALVAIPVAALARPETVPRAHAATLATTGQEATAALASAADRQVGLIR